jgi:hypothetical protein
MGSQYDKYKKQPVGRKALSTMETYARIQLGYFQCSNNVKTGVWASPLIDKLTTDDTIAQPRQECSATIIFLANFYFAWSKDPEIVSEPHDQNLYYHFGWTNRPKYCA